MVAAGHDMRDVELVEDDDAPGAARPLGPASPGGPGHALPRRPPDRRAPRGRWWTVGLVLALLGVAGGEVSSQAGARSSMAALRGVPGVLAPLDATAGERWRSGRPLRAELVHAAGLLVGVMGHADSADVVALDPATGATVWRTPVRPGGPGAGAMRCVAPDPDPPATGDPALAGPEPGTEPGTEPGATAPVVVCVVDRSAHDRRRASPAPGGTSDRVLVLDATSGQVRSERPVPPGTSLAALGPDVVAAHVDADGVVHVTRTDPSGESRRWSFVAARPLSTRHPGWRTRMGVVGHHVVVDEVDGWVLGPDGEVLHAWSGSPAAELEGTARVLAGRLLVRPDSDGGPYPRTEATDLVSGRTFVVQGRPLAPYPDDGSLDGYLLVRSGGPAGLHAYDSLGGDPRWSVQGRVEGQAVVIGGRVVGVMSDRLTAVDGRTGRTVWSTPLVRPARTSVATDGRLAVVTELDRDRGVVLAAYGLDDGRLRWRSDVGDDVSVLTVVGRQLFGWTGEQLVALSAPR